MITHQKRLSSYELEPSFYTPETASQSHFLIFKHVQYIFKYPWNCTIFTHHLHQTAPKLHQVLHHNFCLILYSQEENTVELVLEAVLNWYLKNTPHHLRKESVKSATVVWSTRWLIWCLQLVSAWYVLNNKISRPQIVMGDTKYLPVIFWINAFDGYLYYKASTNMECACYFIF